MKLLMVVKLPLYFFIAICIFIAAAAAAPFGVSTMSFEEGYSPLFGDGNLVRSPDDRSVRLLLDQYSGN